MRPTRNLTKRPSDTTKLSNKFAPLSEEIAQGDAEISKKGKIIEKVDKFIPKSRGHLDWICALMPPIWTLSPASKGNGRGYRSKSTLARWRR